MVFAQEPAFPVKLVISDYAKAVSYRATLKDHLFPLQCDLLPGTYEVVAYPNHENHPYLKTQGLAFHIANDGTFTSSSKSNPVFRFVKRITISIPAMGELVRTKQLGVRWEPIKGVESYAIRVFEMPAAYEERGGRDYDAKRNVLQLGIGRGSPADSEWREGKMAYSVYVTGRNKLGRPLAKGYTVFLTPGADESLKNATEETIEPEEYVCPQLGVRLLSAGLPVADEWTRDYVAVDAVGGGKAAIREGIEPEEKILAVNGKVTPSLSVFKQVVSTIAPGSTVELKLKRGRENRTVTLKLPE